MRHEVLGVEFAERNLVAVVTLAFEPSHENFVAWDVGLRIPDISQQQLLVDHCSGVLRAELLLGVQVCAIRAAEDKVEERV